MARLARIVVPGYPHHITQRGNGRQRVFFSDDDYAMFRDLLAENCRAAGVVCWAFCLMPNHIHALLVPEDEDGLRAALAPTHRRYAGIVNARRKRNGHFWQGRYGAAVMDEAHVLAAFRYMLRNPVDARLVTSIDAWKWSSARAYLRGVNDGLTDTGPLKKRCGQYRSLLKANLSSLDSLPRVLDDETIGRPHGEASFVAAMEKMTGRQLMPGKRGPKPVPVGKKRSAKSQ